MGVLAGPFVAAAVLLGVSGVLKVRRPAPTASALVTMGLRLPRVASLARLLGLAEVVAAAGALLTGGRLFPWVVAGFYLSFAGFVGVSLVSAKAVSDCGCFGASETPPTVLHLVLNLVACGVAGAVGAGSGGGLARALDGQPLGGIPFLVLVGVATALAYAVLTVLPRTLTELAEVTR